MAERVTYHVTPGEHGAWSVQQENSGKVVSSHQTRTEAILAGRDLANPLAAVLTVGMMLSHMGWPEEERRLEAIVSRAIAEKRCTPDVGGELGTRAVGDWVMSELARGI